MEMTNQEIVKSYNQNPSLSQLSVIAELNDCSKDEIVAILRNENILIPKKKPRKSMSKTIDFPSKDRILSDEAENLNKKNVPAEEELQAKPLPNYLIPECIVELVNRRIEEIQMEQFKYCDLIDSLNLEKRDLQNFLKGEIKNGTKNKLFGQV